MRITTKNEFAFGIIFLLSHAFADPAMVDKGPASIGQTNNQSAPDQWLLAESNNEKEIGKRLRLEMMLKYKELRSTSPAKAAATLTASASKYLYSGMSFAVAEKILANAGFEINTDPFGFPPRKGEHHVKTQATLLVESSLLALTAIYVNISLHPLREGDFSELGKVEASISSNSP